MGTHLYSEGQTMKIGIRLHFFFRQLEHNAKQNSRDTQKEEHSFQSFLWLICKEPSTQSKFGEGGARGMRQGTGFEREGPSA